MKKTLLLTSALVSAMASYGQWVSTPEGQTNLYPEDQSYPMAMMAVSSQGDSWFFLNRMGLDSQGEGAEIYFCQGLDAEGMPIMGEQPALLANYPYQTYVMVNDNIFTDRDGNALMAVQDSRVEQFYHTTSVYKISPEGEQLWGEDGVLVSGDIQTDFLCGFTGCQISDGSYVFAWMNTGFDNGYKMEINIVRVLADGSFAWEPGTVRLSDENNEFWYPYLVDGGNGQFILVYAEGGSQVIKAMKYDFDGTPVWGEPTEIYNGGWGSTPMWTKCGVKPSGDNGVLFYWYDDRYFTNYEDPYLAYVKPNGKLGFNVRNGLKLDYQEYTRDLGIDVVYDPGTDSFVAVFLSASGTQAYYQLKAQRVSKSGDLLWGEEAMLIGEMVEGRYGYESVVTGEPGRVAFFYEKREGFEPQTQNICDYFDVATGERVWEEPLEFGPVGSAKCDLQTGTSGKFWVASWITNPINSEGFDVYEVGNISVQRINYDGTFGNGGTGISNVLSDNSLDVTVNGHVATFASETSVYDLTGRLISRGMAADLNPGIYMCVSEGRSVKFRIR